MIHLSLLLVGFLLGVFAVGILVVLMVAHRKPAPPPVLRRRANRDRLPEVGNPPPMSVCKPAREAEVSEVGGISYQWLGVTGSEQE